MNSNLEKSMPLITNRDGQTPSQFITQLAQKIENFHRTHPQLLIQDKQIAIEILIHRELNDHRWVLVPDASN